MKRILLMTTIAMAAGSVSSAQISTLATMAVEGPLRVLAKDFAQQTGKMVNIQVDTSPNITRRLAGGETADVLIALATTVDQALKDGRAIAGSRAAIGRIGVGVAMSRGGRRPDISTVDALKASLLQADAVLLSEGASGALVARMLGDIGVADQVKAKTVRLSSGGAVMERLGEGRGSEIGFTMISEIRSGESHGGSLVGALPAAIQMYTAYDAVVMSGSRDPDAARAFIRVLTTPGARQRLAATGWEF